MAVHPGSAGGGRGRWEGAVTGYGYEGADALAVNGRPLFSRHTVRPKVQAAADLNHDGRFTGTVYAFCEGGR